MVNPLPFQFPPHLFTIVLLSISIRAMLLDYTYRQNHTVLVFMCFISLKTWYQIPSTLLKMTRSYFLYVRTVSPYISLIFSLAVHQLKDARLSSIFSYCDYCCSEHGSAYILQHINFITFLWIKEVGLLDHMKELFLIF